MAVRKIRNSWWVDIRYNNTRYRKRSPDNSKAGAEAYESTLRQKLARGESISKEKSEQTRQNMTFQEFAQRWFKEYVVSNNKYSEQRTKKYILNAELVPFFGNIPINEITTHHVEQFKAKQLGKGIKHKTVNNRLTVLRTCLSTAKEWLGVEVPKVKWMKFPPPRTDFLSHDECNLLLRSASGIVYEMLLAALRTGMRQGELKALQWSSIDWQNGFITVRHSWCDYRMVLDTPKGNRERHIPLDAELSEILYRRKKKTGFVFLDEDGQPFNNKRLDRRMTQICERSGLRRITWHVLRHTFASHLATAGVPLNVVQALLGHTSINTTMRYAHLYPSALREAIDILNARSTSRYFGQPVVNRPVPTLISEHKEKIAVPKNL